MRADQVKMVRVAIGVALMSALPSGIANTLRAINQFIADRVDNLDDASWNALKVWPQKDEAVVALHEATSFEKVYKDAVELFAQTLGVSLSDSSPAPTPTPTPEPAPEPKPTPIPIVDAPAPTGDFAKDVLAVLRAAGLYIEDGCFGFGGIDPRSAATMQVFGNRFVGDGSIQFNTANGNVATKSLSGDGGLRDLNNQRVTKEAVDAYDPDGNVHFKSHLEVVDPNKHHSQIGTDSKHNPSWKRVLPANAKKPDGSPYAPHEYTQDVVMEINEDEKQIRWASYRRGWEWVFASDAKYGPLRLYRIFREWMQVFA